MTPTASHERLLGAFVAALLLTTGCSTTSTPRAPAAGAPATASGGAASAPGTPAPDSAETGTSAAPPPAKRAGNAPFYYVNGSRYQLLPSAEGYRERGIASWYGGKFHGRKTANGEIYDMHALTAAHKTLPIPSYVRVRNVTNGREVVVRVNDRGPFVKGRLIDLSYEAARRLDLVRAGTGAVEVAVVPAPATVPESVAEAPPSPRGNTPAERPPAPETAVEGTSSAVVAAVGEPAAGGSATTGSSATDTDAAGAPPRPTGGAYQSYYVQVGAFGDAENAENMRTRLRALGFSNVVVQRGQPPQPEYRVKVGPLGDEDAYDVVIEQMRGANIHDTFLTTN
jgi:rare lipoprotein A